VNLNIQIFRSYIHEERRSRHGILFHGHVNFVGPRRGGKVRNVHGVAVGVGGEGHGYFLFRVFGVFDLVQGEGRRGRRGRREREGRNEGGKEEGGGKEGRKEGWIEGGNEGMREEGGQEEGR
jgi:hypothetical protein